MESAERNGVVSGREVEKYNACLTTRLKRVLDVVGEEGDLIHHRLPLAETRLLIRQLRIDYWVDECVEVFHELVRDAEMSAWRCSMNLLGTQRCVRGGVL